MGNGEVAVWGRLIQIGHKQVHFMRTKTLPKLILSFQPNPAHKIYLCALKGLVLTATKR